MRPKTAPSGTLLAIKIGQKINRKLDCSKYRPKIAPRPPKTLQDHPKSAPGPPKTGPRPSQERPRIPQDRPKTPQDAPETTQDPPKTPPRAPQDPPRAPQDHPRPPKIAQDPPKSVPRAPKSLQDRPKTPKNAPKMPHVLPRTAKNSAAGTWERDRQTCFLVCRRRGVIPKAGGAAGASAAGVLDPAAPRPRVGPCQDHFGQVLVPQSMILDSKLLNLFPGARLWCRTLAVPSPQILPGRP